MVSTFYDDLNKARGAEHLVCQVLENLTEDYTFTEVGDVSEYFHKGDIMAVDDWGDELFVEVKDDGCISYTGNVLCEDKVFYRWSGTFGSGNMKGDSDYYAVVSQSEKLIYVLDFSVMKQVYKMGRYKVIPHPEQITYCYLCSLNSLREQGALLYIIEYEQRDGVYHSVSVEYCQDN